MTHYKQKISLEFRGTKKSLDLVAQNKYISTCDVIELAYL